MKTYAIVLNQRAVVITNVGSAAEAMVVFLESYPSAEAFKVYPVQGILGDRPEPSEETESETNPRKLIKR